MTILRLASLRSFRLSATLLSAFMVMSVAATTGCGGGGQSTKVEMPENATPLPDESMRREVGHSATPKGRNIQAR